jgi:rhodanese-related sulfurtransferase
MKVFVLIITIILSIGSNIHQKNAQECFTLLSADDFNLKLYQDNTVVIDVRILKEYKRSRISGAVSTPDKETLITFCNNLDVNTTILVYCSDGYRSETASLILCSELNYKNIYSLNRGLESWVDRGYDLDKTRFRNK